MKTTIISRVFATVATVGVLSFGTAAFALADDHHDAWSHDKSGYWDDHGRHQAFVEHEHHHGYWRTNDSGARVFINID